MFSDFHFLRPLWLLAIVVLVLLLPWLSRYLRNNSGWQKFIAPHLLTQLVKQPAEQKSRSPIILVCSAWIIASVALAGPTWEKTLVPLQQTDRGVVIVMDMSLSTRASDVSPDRLTRLKYKAIDLLENIEAAQVGLVAYAGDAFTISPLTPDVNNILTLLPGLSPEIMPVAGNYPLLAMQEADRLLKDSGIQQGEIYWLSAGMSRDDMQELNQFFANNQHRLSALTAGQSEGAPIRLQSGDMLRDNQGRIVMAQLNPDYFSRVTRQTGGRYSRLSADNRDIQRLLEQGPAHEQLSDQESTADSHQWRDLGPYLALLLLPLALIVSRRGVLWSVLPLLLLLPPPLKAAENPVMRSLQNTQQRAQALYEQGQYEPAAELYQDPLRRGNAFYRAGEYETAIQEFSRDDSAEAWYNRGNSYAQLGDLEQASDAYDQALQRRPGWQQAEENKQLVDELKEQQPPSEGEGEDDAESDPSEAENQEQEQQGDNQHDAQQDAQADTDENATEEAEPGNDEEEQAEPAPSDDDPGMSEEELQQAQAQLADEDDLSDEEREELEQLLRRIPDDPATLLRNRMRIEAQRRQTEQPPRGARQQW
ncbi:hypothetical protein CWE09_00385 [Aliidiomarina minuta]|uniref:VWFA domain-containing protein n=1 Tax=Aliidiomarina minuta TaxID=880057 RepID=A0A432W589_9GAMM|nr:tetratricopeptide repeat protein [Aliidiomarina minuta]RUO25235.1 hypothetical protein CWE09_00385 [Aliidiomarina minuta]